MLVTKSFELKNRLFVVSLSTRVKDGRVKFRRHGLRTDRLTYSKETFLIYFKMTISLVTREKGTAHTLTRRWKGKFFILANFTMQQYNNCERKKYL